MYYVFVFGKGPAGLSAAIYAVRAGLSVLVIGRDKGALAQADLIENYWGFPEPVPAARLLADGEAQVRRLGAELLTEEVTGLLFLENYGVKTTMREFETRSLVVATGLPRKKAAVPGLQDFEGRGVSYCATCDGFFYRGKKVVVIGNGDYAFKEACELKPFASRITLLTNGRPYAASLTDEAIAVDLRPIAAVSGDAERVRRVEMADGSFLEVDGVFVAEGTASALDLAQKLGLAHDGKVITVNSRNQDTSLPGVFAAGDCTGGLLQIAVAVGDGARAGMAAANYVRQLDGGEALKVQWH
jgi:thioredoxin reductase (NADPH)